MSFTISFLGPAGSYCHHAARQYALNESKSEYELKPITSIRGLFEELNGTPTSDICVIPLANSTNGGVIQTLELISQNSLKNKSPTLNIISFIKVPVQHCLAGYKQNQKDPKDLSHIRTLRTHSQAWTQCTKFLDQNFDATVVRFDEDSTSAAAGKVSKDTSRKSAAICSNLAARLYKLDILAQNIQSETENETGFIVVKKLGGDSSSVENDSSTSLEVFYATLDQSNVVQKQIESFKLSGKVYTRKDDLKGTWYYIFSSKNEDLRDLINDLEDEGLERWSWGTWNDIKSVDTDSSDDDC